MWIDSGCECWLSGVVCFSFGRPRIISESRAKLLSKIKRQNAERKITWQGGMHIAPLTPQVTQWCNVQQKESVTLQQPSLSASPLRPASCVPIFCGLATLQINKEQQGHVHIAKLRDDAHRSPGYPG